MTESEILLMWANGMSMREVLAAHKEFVLAEQAERDHQCCHCCDKDCI